jgi:hypothetical protein
MNSIYHPSGSTQATVTPSQQKSALVHIGQYALSTGQWQMVAALTRLIQKGGLVHV